MVLSLKLAVFSDSHKNISNMLDAVTDCRPDVIIHLGDHVDDALQLSEQFPHIPLYSVAGNCDYSPASQDSILTELGGVRIFMAHGHRYSVKLGLDAFLNSVSFSGAKLGLFGHTHRPICKQFGDITLLNPGSCGTGAHQSWAQIEIINSQFFCKIIEF